MKMTPIGQARINARVVKEMSNLRRLLSLLGGWIVVVCVLGMLARLSWAVAVIGWDAAGTALEFVTKLGR